MWYVTAARTYGLDIATAKFVLDAYRRAIPEIPLWWLDVDATVNATSVLTNPVGRRRMFFGRHDDDLFRSAYSFLPQSLVADIINRALHLSYYCFDLRQCSPVLQVHDELVFRCKRELVHPYARKIRRLMEYPVKFPGVDVPLVVPADVSFGPNWFDQEKIKDL
jgi:DNA polymerase I-like protein with 3'-5' exonuclease and polymerase domains